MGELFAAGPELPYDERTQLLMRQGVAVWDVLASGSRPGSMDASIDEENAMPNDFVSLCSSHPELRLVCFNGQAAARLFRQLVADVHQASLNPVRFVTMPSTSPAHAAMSFAEKLKEWSAIVSDSRAQEERERGR